MGEGEITRILQETSQGQKVVTVPSQIAEILGWEKGDELQFKTGGEGELRLTRKEK